MIEVIIFLRMHFQMNLQNFIEQPYPFMMFRTKWTVVKFKSCRKGIETVFKHLEQPSAPQSEQSVVDILGFMQGDNSHIWNELELVHGGNGFCCSSCFSSANTFSIVSSTLRSDIRTLSAIVESAASSKYTSERKHLKPYGKMKKKELQEELDERNIYDFDERTTVQELPELVRISRNGVENLPPVMLEPQVMDLNAVNLADAEVVGIEPMHVLKGHTENLLEELSSSHYGKMKQALEKFKRLEFADKVILRARDYRTALHKMPTFLASEGMSSDYYMLFDSLSDVAKLCYMPEKNRSSAAILRLYNQSFMYTMLIKQIIGNPKRITKRKLYGLYFHAIMKHAPLTLRTVSLSSMHVEREERLFHSIKDISSKTSSHKPDNILTNFFLRSAYERSSFNTGSHHGSHNQTYTFKKDSIIPTEWFIKYPASIQLHLQQISDYLAEGQGIWWSLAKTGDIIFHDTGVNGRLIIQNNAYYS
jgi:hypothetical protein